MSDLMTGVAGTAAAHLTATRRSTSSADELTVVWSTRAVRCSAHAPGHLRTAWDEETVPLVWDETGCGDWTVLAHEQCGCGEIVSTPAVVVPGHLDDDELAAIARSVADEASATADADYERVWERLMQWLRTAALHVADPTNVSDDELDDLPYAPRADESEPGVWAPEGRLEAWDYDVDGDVVVATIEDLPESVMRRRQGR